MVRVLLCLIVGLLAIPAIAAPPLESFVEAPGPGGALKGTMLVPAGSKDAPIVLIVPGSGPTDRDGDNPLGVKARPYRLLAEKLATLGVASVRIDKRGMFASRAAIADANKVTIADYADDVHAWARAIRAGTGARCIWVLGHSEGGLVALAAAQRPADLCGIVLVSAPGRRLGAVLRAQLEANPANASLLPGALAAIDALEVGRTVDPAGLDPALQRLFAPAVQPFLIDVFAYDPARLAAKVTRSMLIVQGERDLQVSVEDARRLAAARPGAALLLFPDMNHVLKFVAGGDRAVNAASYADPSLPIMPGLAEAVARFVRGGMTTS